MKNFINTPEDTMLQQYSVEIFGNKTQLTLENLINSHRYLKQFMEKSNTEITDIRDTVRKQAEIDSVEWLKHGQYISKEKLESMTILEIAEFLSM